MRSSMPTEILTSLGCSLNVTGGMPGVRRQRTMQSKARRNRSNVHVHGGGNGTVYATKGQLIGQGALEVCDRLRMAWTVAAPFPGRPGVRLNAERRAGSGEDDIVRKWQRPNTERAARGARNRRADGLKGRECVDRARLLGSAGHPRERLALDVGRQVQ
ncbi:MAG: hypothetical protein ACRD15_07720 [Vicinamibacterales bacterium]